VFALHPLVQHISSTKWVIQNRNVIFPYIFYVSQPYHAVRACAGEKHSYPQCRQTFQHAFKASPVL